MIKKMIANISRITSVCSECGGSIISIEEKGETVCEQCGLIMDERLVDFSHSGKRAYTYQEKT